MDQELINLPWICNVFFPIPQIQCSPAHCQKVWFPKLFCPTNLLWKSLFGIPTTYLPLSYQVTCIGRPDSVNCAVILTCVGDRTIIFWSALKQNHVLSSSVYSWAVSESGIFWSVVRLLPISNQTLHNAHVVCRCHLALDCADWQIQLTCSTRWIRRTCAGHLYRNAELVWLNVKAYQMNLVTGKPGAGHLYRYAGWVRLRIWSRPYTDVFYSAEAILFYEPYYWWIIKDNYSTNRFARIWWTF